MLTFRSLGFALNRGSVICSNILRKFPPSILQIYRCVGELREYSTEILFLKFKIGFSINLATIWYPPLEKKSKYSTTFIIVPLDISGLSSY